MLQLAPHQQLTKRRAIIITMLLHDLGLTPEIEAAFAPHAGRGLILGRIGYRDRERCRLYTDEGEIAGDIAGALWYRASSDAELPAVGDWVAARPVGPGAALVEAVLPRRTQFSRRAAGRREQQQVIAANVDLVFIVTGLDHDYNLRRIERYLTLARESGADAVVVLNKADLCPDVDGHTAQVRTVARGAPVVAASAARGDLAALQPYLAPGRTIALLGSSGAGKSTILNALLGAARHTVRDVRESDGRGRHTTTFRELVPLPGGGALIDNPGMRELQLWAGEESLNRTFDDVEAIAGACRFRNCTHDDEPGCAVRTALEEGRLDAGRWESYRKLLAEVRHHETMTDARAAIERKEKWKRIHKAMRQHYRLRERQ